jgi:UDP-N-acetyl-D-galactosamine dehydrogenase
LASPTVAVIGLGYVGLPLALALARHYVVTAYDISISRIAELKNSVDVTGEISASELADTSLVCTNDTAAIGGADYLIISVPTPVDSENRPDLSHVLSACQTIGQGLKKGATVVLESTVYPGVTEDICGPELEAASGLVSGQDFFLGYSPERINPGDKKHTIDKITKVVAGQTPEVAKALSNLYGAITSGGIFVAKTIKTAEAAKVIENAQRDINIAFINEVGMIFNRLGLSTHDVLDVARTKWNFLDFEPGLVGGHCIGVDPYYLSHLASEMGHRPEVVLAGRKINDGMAKFIAGQIGERLAGMPGQARILILGLTFKQNVPDLRNSKVVDLINALKEQGHKVDVHDPIADVAEAKRLFGLTLLEGLDGLKAYDCMVGAVCHSDYAAFSSDILTAKIMSNGLVVDLKGMWRSLDTGLSIIRMEI